MLLNCLPFPIAGARGRGRGRGRATVLLSEIPSASGDVASQTAFSESRDEEMDSRDLEVDSREQESGPSSASTKKPKVRGETEVPKEEPAPEARILIEPTRTE